MKNSIYVIFGLILTIKIISCGPSKAELERQQQAMTDSVAKVTEERVIRRLEEERIAQENQLKIEAEKNRREHDRRELLELIDHLETELEVQKQKLEDIKTPKLLRTVDEKEAQVRSQLLVIKRFKKQIEQAKSILAKIEAGQQYTTSNISNYDDTSAINVKF